VKELKDRTVLITGAAGGIGGALARAFAERGAHLALVDVDPDRLGKLVDSLQVPNRRVTSHLVDVRSTEAWAALAVTLNEQHGGLDVLVHNAGVTVHGPFGDQPLTNLEWLLDINLRGPVRGTHALLPLLKSSESAHVVLVSSMAALFGAPTQAVYGASKAGLRNFGAALRVELVTEGIGVTTVLPGAIATGFLSRARTSDVDESAWMARKMQLVGTLPETVAAKVIRGLRWNRREVRVGWDSVAVDLLQRWMPSVMPTLLSWGWRIRERWF
jgi:short-subunit dehydrogenase